MKSGAVVLFFLLAMSTGYAQDLMYEVRGKHVRSIKKETLNSAHTMADLSPGYPSAWITEYLSTEITTTCNGKVIRAESNTESLTLGQKNILAKADLGTDIVINNKYYNKNSVTDKVTLDSVYFTVTLVPEIEAAYQGGYKLLSKYLKESAIDKIVVSDNKKIVQSIVRFTVDEQGDITNVTLAKTSDDPQLDCLLLEAIHKMPRWSPASTSNGKRVKQDFEFIVGNAGC